MRAHIIVALAVGLMSVGSFAQDAPRKPRISDVPLTAEQVAIYRAAIKHYLKNVRTSMNLASLTEPFNFGGPSSNDACVNGAELDKPDASASVVHKLDGATLNDSRIVLVESEKQVARIMRSDPQTLIKEAVEGKPVTEDDVGATLNDAFATGMLSLSEIVFDKTHQRAVMSYSFFCGSLCGHGETLIFRYAGHQWKIKGACGGWIS